MVAEDGSFQVQDPKIHLKEALVPSSTPWQEEAGLWAGSSFHRNGSKNGILALRRLVDLD